MGKKPRKENTYVGFLLLLEGMPEDLSCVGCTSGTRTGGVPTDEDGDDRVDCCGDDVRNVSWVFCCWGKCCTRG